MTSLRMTMLSRSPALLALFAACVNTQPLAAQSVKQVTVTVDSATIGLGHRTTAHASVRLANGHFATNRVVSWGTSKPGIVLVSDKGVVSTITQGTASIAAIVGGVKGEAAITVTAGGAPLPPVVASVTVSLAATSVPRGATTTATAIARDSSGDVLANRSVTWASLAPSVASVSGGGAVTAVALGTTSILAAVDGKTAGASVTVVAPPAIDTTTPTTTAEPTYSAITNTLVYADSIDGYASAHAMWIATGSGMRIKQGFSEDVGALSLITGKLGTGKALRMSYTGFTDSHDWDVINAPVLPDTTTHFFQFSGRFQIAALNGVLAIKFFEAYHRDGTRVQWNTHDHLPCPAQGGVGTYFQVYDQAATTCQGNQAIAPFAQDVVVDQSWHRYTFQYRPNTASGSRDGIARMWIDGTKVIDISASAVGITPPGGYKPWCAVDDVDALSRQGIEYIRWGGQLSTLPGSPFTFDIDDFVWWRPK